MKKNSHTIQIQGQTKSCYSEAKERGTVVRVRIILFIIRKPHDHASVDYFYKV